MNPENHRRYLSILWPSVKLLGKPSIKLGTSISSCSVISITANFSVLRVPGNEKISKEPKMTHN